VNATSAIATVANAPTSSENASTIRV
jgi:hypothetical protein